MAHLQLISPVGQLTRIYERLRSLGAITKNIAPGEAAPRSSAKRDVDVVEIDDQFQWNGPAMGNVLGSARDYSDSAHDHLMTDVHPDAGLTRIVVDRRMQYVQTHYTSWPDGLARVVLGVIRLIASNSIKMQYMAVFFAPRVGYQLSPFGRMEDVPVPKWRVSPVRRSNSRVRTSDVRGVRVLRRGEHLVRRSETSEPMCIRDIRRIMPSVSRNNFSVEYRRNARLVIATHRIGPMEYRAYVALAFNGFR